MCLLCFYRFSELLKAVLGDFCLTVDATASIEFQPHTNSHITKKQKKKRSYYALVTCALDRRFCCSAKKPGKESSRVTSAQSGRVGPGDLFFLLLLL